MMHRSLFPGILTLFIAYVITSCSENLCEESTDVYLNMGFYTTQDGYEKDSLVYNLTVFGAGQEDNLLYESAIARKVKLPLNPSANSCTFIIRIDATEDTFTLEYSSQVTLVSHDCGFIAEYDILDVSFTGINIDSAAVIRSTVKNINEEHVKIYL